MIYLDLILNLSLLVSLSIISGFIETRWSRQTRLGQVLQGLLFGSVAVIGMLRPLVLAPGLIFDGRSIMISLCAFFFGPWAALVAMIPPVVCRIGVGGAGVIQGVLLIFFSAAIGLLAWFRFIPDRQPPSMGRLYLFGLAVHLMMVALMWSLPEGMGWRVVKVLGLPVLLFYPLATILAGKILADQTAAIRNLARLRESEELFHSLFENHLAVKLLIDADTGRIVDANQAAAAFYGWSQEQLRQMRIQDINTLSPEEIKQEIAKAKAGERVHFEFRHRRADGSIRDVAVFSSKVLIKERALLHSIVQDISEQKEGERRLREQEIKYRSLFDNAPIGIFATTSQGRVLALNDVMAKILELDSPQAARDYYTNLGEQLWASAEGRDQFLRQLRDRGRVENFEFQARTVHGKAIWLSMNARLAEQKEDGSFTLEGFATDITERHVLEEQFRQAQKMESVGRLAGGVAHDFNNMLSVILGYAQIGLRTVDPAAPLYGYLQEISKAAQRSKQITQQLLAFARRQTVAPQVLDLNATVTDMLKMLHRLIGEDIDLAWKPDAGLWPVKIDPSQVDQILVNLCVNGRDAIADVGKITIETHNVTFDRAYCADHIGFVPGEYVQMVVSDTGCGMDRKTLDCIFEPFFTTKELGRGTGLGLATVYGIVKQNGGFINVYSEPSKGTSFHLYLPRQMEQVVERVQEKTEESRHGQGECILVVEDEESILKLTKVILEGLGYVVLTAAMPVEALRLAQEHSGGIHLLLTDVVMPGLNGRELAERLQSLYPEIRCLFMSGYTANVIAHRGILDEGVSFIAKPFSREELAVKVREALGDRSQESEDRRLETEDWRQKTGVSSQ
jgi:PAS domain S-box-containing protein